MNMREMFVETTKELIRKDPKVALILGGISVASFDDVISEFPERVFDAGIMEQSDLSIASGMAITGMIPIFHTIAPFLAERAYEQLKIDFGYQRLGGVFISNGASIDYSSFGATHQCPAEVSILKQIPGMQVIVAGTPDEFRALYMETYNNGDPTYLRLSREVNPASQDVHFGKANLIKKGRKATVLAVGPMLKYVLEATEDMDVTVLYYTTVSPFDRECLAANFAGDGVLVCEPYYEGALDYDIINTIDKPIRIKHVGMPLEFCMHYGSTKENYEHMGLTVDNIKSTLKSMI